MSELKHNQGVVLAALGYKDRRGYLTRPAVSEKDGTARWYIALEGSFAEIPFRIDEFKPI